MYLKISTISFFPMTIMNKLTTNLTTKTNQLTTKSTKTTNKYKLRINQLSVNGETTKKRLRRNQRR